MERNLSFQFAFADDEQNCPESVLVHPNPNHLEDSVLLLTASTCIRSLANRHSLEQALKMVENAAYGRLDNDGPDGKSFTRFDMIWTDQPPLDTP